MALNREIKFFTVEDEKTYENPVSKWGSTETVMYLDIFSRKAAALLNAVINWKVESCNTKHRTWGSVGVDDLIGGGLFVKCRAEVVVTTIGEVGLKFEERGNESIRKYIRISNGTAERLSSIKDKLGNELKKYWNAYSKSIDNMGGKFNIKIVENGTTEEFEITETDYRILYEVLKGRNINKLKGKYAAKKWDEMIGKKIEDQFILTAIETIKGEISKVVEMRESELKRIEEDYNTQRNNLNNIFKSNQEKVKTEAEIKIKELQEQINGMKNVGTLMAEGFTF